MAKKKIDILKMNSTKGTKWGKLPLVYKIIIIVLIILLFFVPILVIPQFQ